MRTALGLLLLTPFLAATSASAAVPQVDVPALAAELLSRSHASEALQEAVRRGRLTPHDARMQRFYASFRPDLLDPAFAGLRDGEPGCVSDLLSELRGHWAEVPPEDRHLIELESSPIYRQWLDEGGITWLEGDVEAVRGQQRSACFSPQDVNPGLGPYSEVTSSEHFELHWNPGNGVTQGRIDDLLTWFEESWQFQVIDRGFYQPQGMSTNHMLVTVEELNSPGIGAYATLGQCFGSYMTYIVVNEWSFGDMEWLRSTAPHEFFHGVQFVYGAREFWLDPETRNRWLVEASATYMQRVVYDWLYSVEVQQAFRWATEPHRSLETADESGLQYGLVIFLLSLTETVGGNEWHQLLWEQIRDRSGFELRDELDDLLADYDTDFLTEWRRFMIRGATGMEEDPYLISPLDLRSATGGQMDDAIVGRFDGQDYPIDEDVNSGSGHERPEYLGTNYAVFEGDRIADDVGAILTFRGAGETDGERVEWVVELAAVYNDTVRATYSMPLTREGDDVVGSVLVNEIGEDFDYVVMAVSPVSDFGGGVVSWSFTGELADSTGAGGFVPVPDEVPVDEGNGCSGCASTVAATHGGGSLGLALMLAALLRRRREGSER
jgi:hypothetical protein